VIGRVPDGTRVGITGLGTCVPEATLGNSELASRLGVTKEWIVKRSGIDGRHVVGNGDSASGLAVRASRAALEVAGVDPGDLDTVIVATVTPEQATPAVAALVARELGASVAAYDLSAACTGFVYGLAQAYALIASGLAARVLVVGVDVLSRVTDWNDRATAILFGDGAGAAVVEDVREAGFLGFDLGCDGAYAADLTLGLGGSIRMNGAAVYRFSTREVPASVERLLERCGIAVDAVDVYAPHQSNRRIIEQTVRRLGLREESVVLNIDRYGNTSAASIPLALADAEADGRLREGSLVLLTGVGAGMTFGSALLRWGAEGA
jgi:3-oxoacyl-[acyl-carrier-protein] synthase III